MSHTFEVNAEVKRPSLLVSVRNAAEIQDAIAGGADWIDFKEPSQGALGSVNIDQACRMVKSVGGRCPVSAALGELVDWQDSPTQQLLSVPDITVVKIGLASSGALSNWTTMWENAFHQAAGQGKTLCAVIYADWPIAAAPQPDAILELAIRAGARYLLIDTWDKRSKSTLECLPQEELEQIVQLAKRAGLQTVLAGNLQIANIPSVVELETDLLAVRGAACQGGRTGHINRASVQAIQTAISRASRANEAATQNR